MRRQFVSKAIVVGAAAPGLHVVVVAR